MNADAIVIEMDYPYSVEQVWSALIDPEALGAWLMPNDFEPRVGHHFTFRTAPDQYWNGIVQCRVVEVNPLHRIAYTWQGDTNQWETLVAFTIEPTDGGTHLRLEHSGFAAGGKIGFSVRDILASGWNSKILREKLPAILRERADNLLSHSTNEKENRQ